MPVGGEGDILDNSFFTRPPIDCAHGLIGCEFWWGECGGEIVETEAYASEGDPACHTYFRPSARRFVDDHEEGTSYIYLNYGVHWLFNLLVKSEEGSGFVLFRALHPRSGLGQMRLRRKRENVNDLCSGPGKLTQALGIDGWGHGRNLLAEGRIRIVKSLEKQDILACERIGISRGRRLPWRFLKADSPSISVQPPGRGGR